jgi:hypothetical protein
MQVHPEFPVEGELGIAQGLARFRGVGVASGWLECSTGTLLKVPFSGRAFWPAIRAT